MIFFPFYLQSYLFRSKLIICSVYSVCFFLLAMLSIFNRTGTSKKIKIVPTEVIKEIKMAIKDITGIKRLDRLIMLA